MLRPRLAGLDRAVPTQLPGAERRRTLLIGSTIGDRYGGHRRRTASARGKAGPARRCNAKGGWAHSILARAPAPP
jgi:hypothetical protein